jgi:hypothetical protein
VKGRDERTLLRSVSYPQYVEKEGKKKQGKKRRKFIRSETHVPKNGKMKKLGCVICVSVVWGGGRGEGECRNNKREGKEGISTLSVWAIPDSSSLLLRVSASGFK